VRVRVEIWVVYPGFDLCDDGREDESQERQRLHNVHGLADCRGLLPPEEGPNPTLTDPTNPNPSPNPREYREASRNIPATLISKSAAVN
jgi:hypothetical protein